MGGGDQEEKIRQWWGGSRWFVEYCRWELLAQILGLCCTLSRMAAAARQDITQCWCRKMRLVCRRWIVVVRYLVAVQGGVLGVEGMLRIVFN